MGIRRYAKSSLFDLDGRAYFEWNKSSVVPCANTNTIGLLIVVDGCGGGQGNFQKLNKRRRATSEKE